MHEGMHADTEETHSNYSWKRDPFFWAYSILLFLPIVMVFVFYNYYSLDFLVYAGWILLVFSVVIICMHAEELKLEGDELGRKRKRKTKRKLQTVTPVFS